MIILQTSAEEAEKLRSLAEHQVADALATAQHEREHRLALKKEFEQVFSFQIIHMLINKYNFFGRNFLRFFGQMSFLFFKFIKIIFM